MKTFSKYLLAGIAGFGLCFAFMAAELSRSIDVKLPDGSQVSCYNLGERWK